VKQPESSATRFSEPLATVLTNTKAAKHPFALEATHAIIRIEDHQTNDTNGPKALENHAITDIIRLPQIFSRGSVSLNATLTGRLPARGPTALMERAINK